MKIVGIVLVYNEEDIIEESLTYLISQRIEPVVLDNGSTDRTYEICKKFFDNDQIKLERFFSKKFDLALSLRKLYDLALMQSPDWMIRTDADEFQESGVDNLSLKDAISEEASKGYNLIQFNGFNFFMTDDDDLSANSIRERMKYYSFANNYLYRAWKVYPGIYPYDGHMPVFPYDQKYVVSPRKMVQRHYRFRSTLQAEKKMKERLSRINGTAEFRYGWHVHYDKIKKENFSEKLDHNILTKYFEDNQWNLKEKFKSYIKLFSKKEDIFSEDGSLKIRPKSIAELHLVIKNQEDHIKNLENKKIELDTLKKEYATLQEDHTKNLENKKIELDTLKKDMDSIHQSFTWKRLRQIDRIGKKFRVYQNKERSEISPQSQKHSMNWPNFFIVGASRAGTTSMHLYLSHMPDIFMSVKKEPNYFSGSSVPDNDPILHPIRDTDEYLSNFSKVKNEKNIGESSVHYLTDSRAPYIIKERISDARILIQLRNPIERSFSYYLHLKRGGWLKETFHELIEKIIQKRDFSGAHNILKHSLYADNVERYLKIFGKDKVKIIIFEEFVKDTKNIVQDILKFLSSSYVLGDDFEPYAYNQGPRGQRALELLTKDKGQKSVEVKELIKKNVGGSLSNYKPSMEERDKKLLTDFFREDVEKLQKILDRKLPWIDF